MIPPGKRLHNYEKSPFFVGKSTINWAMFNTYLVGGFNPSEKY